MQMLLQFLGLQGHTYGILPLKSSTCKYLRSLQPLPQLDLSSGQLTVLQQRLMSDCCMFFAFMFFAHGSCDMGV